MAETSTSSGGLSSFQLPQQDSSKQKDMVDSKNIDVPNVPLQSVPTITSTRLCHRQSPQNVQAILSPELLSTSSPKSTFMSLPPEIHLTLIPFLTWPALTSLRRTCTYFATTLLTPNTSSTSFLFSSKRNKTSTKDQLTRRSKMRQSPPPLVIAPHLLQLCILHIQCSRAVSDEETTRLHATLNITNSNWTGLTQGWYFDDHHQSSLAFGSASLASSSEMGTTAKNDDDNDDVARLPCYNCLMWKRAVGPLKSARRSQGLPDPNHDKSTSTSTPTVSSTTTTTSKLPSTNLDEPIESHFAQSMTVRTHDLGKRRRQERICISCGLRSGFYRKGSSPRTQAVCWLCESQLCCKVVKQWTGKIGQRENIVSPVRARDAFFCAGCVEVAEGAERDGRVVVVEGEKGWIPRSWVEFGHWRVWGRYEAGLRRGKKYRDEKGVVIRRERGILDCDSIAGLERERGKDGGFRVRNLHWCPVMLDERMCGCRHGTQGMVLEERKDWPW